MYWEAFLTLEGLLQQKHSLHWKRLALFRTLVTRFIRFYAALVKCKERQSRLSNRLKPRLELRAIPVIAFSSQSFHPFEIWAVHAPYISVGNAYGRQATVGAKPAVSTGGVWLSPTFVI